MSNSADIVEYTKIHLEEILESVVTVISRSRILVSLFLLVSVFLFQLFGDGNIEFASSLRCSSFVRDGT